MAHAPLEEPSHQYLHYPRKESQTHVEALAELDFQFLLQPYNLCLKDFRLSENLKLLSLDVSEKDILELISQNRILASIFSKSPKKQNFMTQLLLVMDLLVQHWLICWDYAVLRF